MCTIYICTHLTYFNHTFVTPFWLICLFSPFTFLYSIIQLSQFIQSSPYTKLTLIQANSLNQNLINHSTNIRKYL